MKLPHFTPKAFVDPFPVGSEARMRCSEHGDQIPPGAPAEPKAFTVTEKNIPTLMKSLPRRNMLAVAIIAWCLVIASSLAWEWSEIGHFYQDLALAEARLFFQKDLTIRKWVAMNGGVYVTPTEKTPPNPYLAANPDRDLITSTGKRLTLINPAYMTRQIHELGEKGFGLRGHITSLYPLRPENAPDAWESKALQAFDGGAAEMVTEELIDGLPYLRMMRPLVTESSCLKCHASQGYVKGDIRGGLSVAVPLSGYFAEMRHQHLQQSLVHLLIGGLGLIGLWVGNCSLRRAEQTMVHREWYFRSMIHSIREDILVIDRHYRITDCNSAALSTFGQNCQEVIGRRCHQVTNDMETGCDQHGHRCPLQVVFATGESVNCLHEYLQTDGSSVYTDLLMSPIKDEQGTITHVIEVRRDVTDLFKSRQEQQILQRQLCQAQKLEAIGQLAGGVAHDYNNILGVILGYSQLALDTVGPDQPLHADLEQIRMAAERGTGLTKQLLAFARKENPEPELLDLNEIVAGMHKMLKRLINENIHLAWRPDTQSCPILIDPSQINQILINLCINARDAIQQNGTITIETGLNNLTDAEAIGDGELPGEYVLLTVSDTGHGMNKEIMEQLFEPFFTTKEQGKGTGLGLATVSAIARQNRGFIRVVSEPGHGSTFQVWLPRHDEKSWQLQETASELPIPLGDETILLVDDERSVLEATRQLLVRLGYKVLAASAPTEAMRLAIEHTGKIHLLITDVVMPEMNGQELTFLLETHFPGLKNLYISGYTCDEIANHLLLSEVGHFLQKPFSKQSLATKVRMVLNELGDAPVIVDEPNSVDACTAPGAVPEVA